MSFDPSSNGNTSRLLPQPGSLEYINRPNPVEPNGFSHGIFDGSTRELDRTTNEQLHPFLLSDRLRQRNDLGPDPIRLARRSPHQSSASSIAAVLNDENSPPRLDEHASHRRDADQAVFTLPKLPTKRHAKRHRVPPVLQGLHHPPPDAGLLPSISTEETQVFLSTSRGSKPAPTAVPTDDDASTVVQQEPVLSAETTQGASDKRSRRNLWTDQETNDLLAGVSRFGIGNWKKILLCPDYQFHKRTAVDLKDRYGKCCESSSVLSLCFAGSESAALRLMAVRGRLEKPRECPRRRPQPPRLPREQRQQSQLHQSPQKKMNLSPSKSTLRIKLYGKHNDDRDVTLQTKKTKLYSKAFENKVPLGSPLPKTKHSENTAEHRQTCAIDFEQSSQKSTHKPV